LMVLAFATIGSVNAFVVPSLTKKALWNNNSNNNVNVNVNVNDSNSKRLSSSGSGSGSGSGSCLWAASSSSSGEEYASLQVGQVVSVRVGDLRSGRKAWKKRRRSDSPILVPCSILGMNRYSMIVYNIRTVLYKYGEYPKSTTHGGAVQNIHNHQIQLSLSRVKKLYKRDTGSPLLVRPHHTHTYIHCCCCCTIMIRNLNRIFHFLTQQRSISLHRFCFLCFGKCISCNTVVNIYIVWFYLLICLFIGLMD